MTLKMMKQMMRCEPKANINFQGDSHRSFDKDKEKILKYKEYYSFGLVFINKIVDGIEKMLYNFTV